MTQVSSRGVYASQVDFVLGRVLALIFSVFSLLLGAICIWKWPGYIKDMMRLTSRSIKELDGPKTRTVTR